MQDEVVSVRLARKDAETIDRRVREGEFLNRSDFVRHAVRAYLEDADEETISRLGLPDAGLARTTARRSARGVKR